MLGFLASIQVTGTSKLVHHDGTSQVHNPDFNHTESGGVDSLRGSEGHWAVAPGSMSRSRMSDRAHLDRLPRRSLPQVPVALALQVMSSRRRVRVGPQCDLDLAFDFVLNVADLSGRDMILSSERPSMRLCRSLRTVTSSSNLKRALAIRRLL